MVIFHRYVHVYQRVSEKTMKNNEAHEENTAIRTEQKKNKVRGSSQFTVTWSTVDVRESLSRYATGNMLFRALQ